MERVKSDVWGSAAHSFQSGLSFRELKGRGTCTETKFDAMPAGVSDAPSFAHHGTAPGVGSLRKILIRDWFAI